MKFKTINKMNKKIIISTIIIIIILLTILLNTSLAKYKLTQSINIARGTINYSIADFNIVAMYQENENGDYDNITIVPSTGYILNKDESYCEISGEKTEEVLIEYTNGAVNIGNITQKGTKCYLYFDIYNLSAKEVILGNMSTITTRSSFSGIVTGVTNKTIYTAEDDDGTSYYYAGAPTDNYLKFGGFYWRIIRINGDETIRIIYSGIISNVDAAGKETVLTSGYNDSSATYTQTETREFNSSFDDNMYEGFMYTSGEIHGIETKSSILANSLEPWYISNLTNYTSYIDEKAGFCNDRTAYTDKAGTISGGGTGTTYTYYAPYVRLKTNKTPNLKCANNSDLFTTNNSNKGNKALTYPIGLITADEVAYAGGVDSTTNKKYYLYTGNYYWTISPSDHNSSIFGSYYSQLFCVNSSGGLDYPGATSVYGVRPVINLRADVVLTGTGTIDDPYLVVGAE